jgi:NADP-dependent 3-hydroxy acid dehydrogenase YdfG
MSNKVIAITGASSGIGAAAARLLAKSGAQLVLGARRQDKLAAVVREIESEGGAAIAVELDVTSAESMNAFIETARSRFGRIDVLVNNAGVMLLAPLADLRVAEWNRMIDVNIKGVLNGVAAALPHMKAQEGGHVVIVGSIAGIQVMPMSGVYAATKHAVRAIAESIRIEGGTAIRSTLIQPGATQTELFDNIEHDGIRQVTQGRFNLALPVDAIARAIVYAVEQPDGVDVNEVTVRPMADKY